MQVSFPVTDRTNFRLSYAHQVQAPDFSIVLQRGINTDRSITNTNNFYGGDLDFGRTITFEFGIRHAFSDDMVLDIAAYNKDNLSNAAGRLISVFDPARAGEPTNLRFMTNLDFGTTPGVSISGSTGGSAISSTARSPTPSKTRRTPARIRIPTSTSGRGC